MLAVRLDIRGGGGAAPGGDCMRIELGADASPDDVVAATRQIVRRLAGADGTRVAAASPRPPIREIATVAREAWSALLGARGLNFPSRTEYVASPFGLSAGGAASFQLGLDSSGERARFPRVESAPAGSLLRRRRQPRRARHAHVFSPAHPDAVSRARASSGERARATRTRGVPCAWPIWRRRRARRFERCLAASRSTKRASSSGSARNTRGAVCRVALPSAPGGRRRTLAIEPKRVSGHRRRRARRSRASRRPRRFLAFSRART